MGCLIELVLVASTLTRIHFPSSSRSAMMELELGIYCKAEFLLGMNTLLAHDRGLSGRLSFVKTAVVDY